MRARINTDGVILIINNSLAYGRKKNVYSVLYRALPA